MMMMMMLMIQMQMQPICRSKVASHLHLTLFMIILWMESIGGSPSMSPGGRNFQLWTFNPPSTFDHIDRCPSSGVMSSHAHKLLQWLEALANGLSFFCGYSILAETLQGLLSGISMYLYCLWPCVACGLSTPYYIFQTNLLRLPSIQ